MRHCAASQGWRICHGIYHRGDDPAGKDSLDRCTGASLSLHCWQCQCAFRRHLTALLFNADATWGNEALQRLHSHKSCVRALPCFAPVPIPAAAQLDVHFFLEQCPTTQFAVDCRYVGDIFLMGAADIIRPNLSVREGLEIVVSVGMALPPTLVATKEF